MMNVASRWDTFAIPRLRMQHTKGGGGVGGGPCACLSLTVSGNAAGTHTALVALHQSHTGSAVSKLPRVNVPDFYVFIPGAGTQEVATEGEAAV